MFSVFRKARGFVAGCILTLAAVVGCDVADSLQSPIAAPRFDVVYADSIHDSYARLNAVVSNSETLTSFRFVIQVDSSNLEQSYKVDLLSETIQTWVEDLKPDTKYLFWAKADNGGGITLFSDTSSFVTLPVQTDTTSTPDNPNNPIVPDTINNPIVPDTINNIDKSYYIEFENETLRKWITLRYDADKDGKIDTIEAKGVHTIELNTDNISSLKGIERLHSLTKLHAEGTRIGDSVKGKLEHIDLSGNPELLQFYAPHNRLKDIDFSKNTKLISVQVNLNDITQINVSMLKEVQLLSVEYNLISTFDCSGLDNLRELHVGHCPNLTSITLNNKVLESLDCADDSELTEIDISKCPLLNGVDFWGCKKLKKIIMSRDQAIGSIRTEPDSNIEFIYE